MATIVLSFLKLCTDFDETPMVYCHFFIVFIWAVYPICHKGLLQSQTEMDGLVSVDTWGRYVGSLDFRMFLTRLSWGIDCPFIKDPRVLVLVWSNHSILKIRFVIFSSWRPHFLFKGFLVSIPILCLCLSQVVVPWNKPYQPSYITPADQKNTRCTSKGRQNERFHIRWSEILLQFFSSTLLSLPTMIWFWNNYKLILTRIH